MNDSAPLIKPRHTLQAVRIPSSEVQDLGFTSFFSWLNSLGYDTTNHSNQRADWARSGGWHLKACKNKVSNQEDFWLISFDGKGGVLLSEKSQQDYRSAYRRLIKEGYQPARIEAMTRGELYSTYNEVRGSAGSHPHLKPSQVDQADFELHPDQIRDMVNSSMIKTYNTYSRFGQARFRNAVLLNSLNVCAVTGVEYRAALDAAHIHPHSNGGAMKVANGIALRKDLHAVFDRGDMAVNPETLTIHFSERAIDSYLDFEGHVIQTVLSLDKIALVARWEEFCSRVK
ncbi:HNH endonuclease [Enterobacter hormaechei]|uniref:HNH endonuclease n=2 Tax=Enterobacteriaceae TaxID=543 RepID=UPI00190A734D|nr:HNH endonuclease signature motif containing protein [Enterobacter hormaechei]EKX4572140.1 HNH endonuclease [Enterobacter hormaechei]EKZ9445041.1 HNH endonuclease [Enterobacter hormaechei]ELJ2089987.1 HNH endonuclease [Enterobacter hormaechei]MBK4309153.1 HNH endonuclease [Enterobacter hormaechei]MBK4459539.1 HNH endonuclease [Enterobacter hormaechei]